MPTTPKPVALKFPTKENSNSASVPVASQTPAIHAATPAEPVTLAQLDRVSQSQSPRAARIAVEAMPANALRVTGVEPVSGASLVNPSPAESAALLRQAEGAYSEGLRLHARQAQFSAVAELMSALRLTAAALDARLGATGGESRIVSAQRGMTALTEAEDFVSPGGRSLVDQPDVAAAVRGHRSNLIQESDAATCSAMQARQLYYHFACEKLATSLQGEKIGSAALHGLGKAMAAVAAQNREAITDARAKAEVFYEAALKVDPENFPAANDLAVLLAEDGRYERAAQLLKSALAISPQPALWNNLAAVHRRLGQQQLAAAARQEAERLSMPRAGAAQQTIPTHNVQWVDNRTFAASGRPNMEIRGVPPQVPAAPAAAPALPGYTNPAAAAAVQPAVRGAPSQPAPQPVRAPIMTAEQPRRTTLVN